MTGWSVTTNFTSDRSAETISRTHSNHIAQCMRRRCCISSIRSRCVKLRYRPLIQARPFGVLSFCASKYSKKRWKCSCIAGRLSVANARTAVEPPVSIVPNRNLSTSSFNEFPNRVVYRSVSRKHAFGDKSRRSLATITPPLGSFVLGGPDPNTGVWAYSQQ